MQDDDTTTTKTGYKNPPQATRFKPGQSGNAKGRPKSAKNFATVIEEELKVRIPITENGRRRMISKREAVAKQLVNKAAGGDHRAIPLLLNHSRQAEIQPDMVLLPDTLAEEDALVIDSIIRRIRQADKTSITAGPPAPSDDHELPSKESGQS